MSHTIYAAKIAKRRNSTLQPTLTTSFDVLLKTPTSLHTPTFTINAASFDYNYLKWGDRYYFVTDVTSRNNSLWEVSAVCDVLATFKTDILASTQFVSYSSENTSTWLADTRIPLLQSTNTDYRTTLTGILSTIGTYILTVVGENGSVIYATQNRADLDALISAISTWEITGITDALSNISFSTPSYERANYRVIPSGADNPTCFQYLIDTIVQALEELGHTASNVMDSYNQIRSTIEAAAVEAGFVGNAYANAPSCIRSCIWVPFDFALIPAGGTVGGSGNVMLGNFDCGFGMATCGTGAVTDTISITIPWHYSDWRRSICEDVYLYLPLVGMVQLSGDSLTHVSSLSIDWSATYTDGVICYKVRAGNEVIGSYGGQCATNYPLGINQQASAGEVVNTAIAGIEKSVSTLVDSSISPVSAAGAIGGFAAELAIAGYNVENVKKSSHISCVGGVGGGAGIGLGRDVVCYTVAHPTVVNPSDMVATMGYPTMKPMALSTLTGYCQCANAHVGATGAEAQELEELDAYLNSGFYIE